MQLCGGHYKNGKACTYKAKKDGFCLVHSKSSKPECSICYEAMTDPFMLPCLHGYCKGCLVKWIETLKNTCPMCRHKIPYDLIKKSGAKPKRDLIILTRAELVLFHTTNELQTIEQRHTIVYLELNASLIHEARLRQDIRAFLAKRLSDKEQEEALQREITQIENWSKELQDNPDSWDVLEKMIGNLERLLEFERI